MHQICNLETIPYFSRRSNSFAVCRRNSDNNTSWRFHNYLRKLIENHLKLVKSTGILGFPLCNSTAALNRAVRINSITVIQSSHICWRYFLVIKTVEDRVVQTKRSRCLNIILPFVFWKACGARSGKRTKLRDSVNSLSLCIRQKAIHENGGIKAPAFPWWSPSTLSFNSYFLLTFQLLLVVTFFCACLKSPLTFYAVINHRSRTI